ncbi:MAG: ATP-binding protein [Gemmatimonadaceae bacterium]
MSWTSIVTRGPNAQELPIFQDRPELPEIGLGGALPSPGGVVRPPLATGALLALEIDDFDLIERTHGAQFAELVIRHVHSTLRGILGDRDLVARQSGGTMTALLPGASAQIARAAAEELADELRRAPLAIPNSDRRLTLTLSVGVAIAPDHGSNHASLVAAAERARTKVAERRGDAVAVALPPAEEPATPDLRLTGFIGRSDQLRTLTGLLDDALQDRSRLAVVHAEQGVGTTALLRQLGREARVRGALGVVARAVPADLRRPYEVWTQVVEKLVATSRVPRGDWSELPNLVPGAGTRFPLDSAMGPGSGSQYRLLEELTECIAAAAEVRPLLIVLEGMQWADASSWDALEHVLTQLRDRPVLLVVSIADDRQTSEVRDRRVALAARDGVIELAVPRLTRDEVKRWLERALHGQDPGREFLSFVYGHTRGSALHVNQLLRALAEEGVVRHNGEQWELRPASELRMPAGIEALLLRRFDRLSARAQLALQTAAVLGRSVDAELLAGVMGGGEEAARQAMAEATARGFLAPEERGSPRVRFVQELVREVVRGQLPPRRLQRIHRDVAAGLAAFDAADDGSIAAHYDRAGMQREAYARALLAAARAERLYAFRAASEALQLAARNASSPDELAQARAKMAALAERLGRFDEAEELCDLAIEWFVAQEDHEQAISLRLLRERARDQLGQPARRTLEALAQLDAEAVTLGLRADRVEILTALSRAWERLGDPAGAVQIAAEGVRMAEQLGDARLLASALNRYAGALEPGHDQDRKAIQRRAIALFQQVGDSRGQARGYSNLGIFYQIEGDLEGAVDALRLAVEVARTARMPDIWGVAALNLGVIRLKQGAHGEARALFEQALSLFTAVKAAALQLYALYNLAHVELAQGRHREAAEMYEMAGSLAQRIGAADVELGAWGGAGLALLAEDRIDDAMAALDRVAARVVSRADWFQGRELVEALAILLALKLGDAARAVQLFTHALTIAASYDPYGGAWLTAACAGTLGPHAPDEVAAAIAGYAPRVETIGYAELTEKFRGLTAAPT